MIGNWFWSLKPIPTGEHQKGHKIRTWEVGKVERGVIGNWSISSERAAQWLLPLMAEEQRILSDPKSIERDASGNSQRFQHASPCSWKPQWTDIYLKFGNLQSERLWLELSAGGSVNRRLPLGSDSTPTDWGQIGVISCVDRGEREKIDKGQSPRGVRRKRLKLHHGMPRSQGRNCKWSARRDTFVYIKGTVATLNRTLIIIIHTCIDLTKGQVFLSLV